MPAICVESPELHGKSARDRRGIAFGSYDETTIEGMRMTPESTHRAGHPPRQRDRRHGLADLLTNLSRGIDRRHDISTLRCIFEETMRRIVPIRSIQLREGSCPWLTRVDGAGQTEAIALEVLGPDPDRSGLLEASFDPSCGLGEWDFQMLGVAAHVGALVLAIERSRLRLARAGLWDSAA